MNSTAVNSAEAASADEPKTDWQHVLQGALASLVLHMTILIVLGLFTIRAELPQFNTTVFEMLAEAERPTEVFDVAPEAIPDDLQQDEASRHLADSNSELLAEPIPEDAILGEDGSSAAIGPANPDATRFVSPAEAQFAESRLGPALLPSGLDGKGLGEEGQGTGKKGKGTSRFFGLRAAGKSFVYVIDCSGSMADDLKFQRACDEVFLSISDLRRTQRFFIIFYNDSAYPMDADYPLPATPANIEKARSWVAQFTPNNGTRPLSALLYALGLKPDAIYFLSDGIFDPEVIVELRRRHELHSRRVPIHTIAFVNQEGESLMKTIARQSGGKFRFVK